MSTSANFELLSQDIHLAETQKMRLPKSKTKKAFMNQYKSFKGNLVKAYENDFWTPIIAHLKQYSPNEFQWIRLPLKKRIRHLKRTFIGLSHIQAETRAHTLDFAHNLVQVILQHGSRYAWNSTQALQQITCDIWRTFLDESNYCPTKNCLSPAIVWVNDGLGPYSLPKHTVKNVNGSVPIVAFPSGYLTRGILGWTVLGHEMTHTILENNPQALNALKNAVHDSLTAVLSENIDLQAYFANRISEIGADVMSILYFGPAAALGLIAFLRSFDGKLSNTVNGKDEHPVAILRALIVTHVVDNLEIKKKISNSWVNYLETEVRRDFEEKELGISWQMASYCCARVAFTIMNTPIIHNRSLKEIHCWNEEDESITNQLVSNQSIQSSYTEYKGPHIVSAASLCLLLRWRLDEKPEAIDRTFKQMIALLNDESKRRSNDCCPLTQQSITIYKPAPSKKMLPFGKIALTVMALVVAGVFFYVWWKKQAKKTNLNSLVSHQRGTNFLS